MPSISINGESSPDHVVGNTNSTPTYTGTSLPTGRAAANGNHPVRITGLSLFLAGDSGNRTVQSYVADISGSNAAASSSYTVNSGSGAVSTGTKSLSKYIANAVGGDIRAGFENQSGNVFFGRHVKSSRVVITGADTSTFSGYTLAGSLSYTQVPTGCTLSLTATTSTTASLGWSVPSDNGGSALTGYTLQYSTSPAFTSPTNVTTTGTSVTVTGLTPATTYYFRVFARNAVADNFSTGSVWSNTVSSNFVFYWDDVAVTSLSSAADVELLVGQTVTDFDDNLSRDAGGWANQVKVVYNWTTAAGVATSQVDFADGSTAGVPGALLVQTNDNTPYPGAGAGAAILARTQSYGHVAQITAVSDLQFNPRLRVLLVLPSGNFTGTISAITFDLAAKTMTVTTRNLI